MVDRSATSTTERVDLRELDEVGVTTIGRETAEVGYRVFRDQSLRPGELEQFVGRLGSLMFTPGESPLDGHQFLFEVTNRNRTTPPKSVYHSDTSYVAETPAFTVLAAVEVPRQGGETLIIDQYEALQRLPTRLAAEVEGLEFFHIPTRVGQPDQAGAGHWHPIRRVHPVAKRAALYLSARERLAGARRDGVELPEPVATDLIDRFHSHATGSVSPYRHCWRRGDVLLIDNRCTLHAADHSAVDGVRTLHRVMCMHRQ